MHNNVVVILCTTPTISIAKTISHQLVTERLCACATVIDNCTSIYQWKDRVHEDNEVQMILKTTAQCVTRLVERLTTLHPYDVPEVLTVPVIGGFDPYLLWVNTACLPPTDLANGYYD